MPRTLTLKEVSQQFYKNAAFPMVPSVEDIRSAVFETLSGPDRYEIISSSGEILTIAVADELSIGSMELSLRKATAKPTADTTEAAEPDAPEPGDRPTPGETPTTETGGDQYHRSVLEVSNRSLVDPEVRRSIANLLQTILDAVDPDTGGDVQLMDLQLNLTAAAAAVEEIEQRAKTAGTRSREEELDF